MRRPAGDDVAKLGSEMLRFAAGIDQFAAPEAVLDGLHKVTLPACGISVLVAGLLPMRWGDWSGLEKGKTVFLHKSAPDGWWEEWLELSRLHSSPGLALARLSLAPFLKSEMMTKLDPLGIDRWPFELQLRYGIRDGLMCPWAGVGCWRTGREMCFLSVSRMRRGPSSSWALRLRSFACSSLSDRTPPGSASGCQ